MGLTEIYRVFLSKKQIQKRSKILINYIRRGGARERNALSLIYTSYDYADYLESLIVKYKISNQEVQDIVHDAIIILRNNIKEDKVKEDTNIHVYLTSIAKNILQNERRSRKTEEIIDTNWSVYGSEEITEKYFARKEMEEQVGLLLQNISEKCRNLLQLWQQNYSFREIAKLLSFQNEHAARKKKYKCFQRLATHAKDFPELKQFLS